MVSPDAKIRALFVNSGILGHKSVARLLREATMEVPWLEAQHLDLSENLGTFDRIIRRLLCFHPLHSNRDLVRWRSEFNLGWLCSRRIRRLERQGNKFQLLHLHPQPLAYCSLGRMQATPTIISLDATQHLAASEANGSESWTFRPSFAHDAAVFRRAEALIVTSHWAAEYLRREVPNSEDKIQVMPYPISLKQFDEGWITERFERARHPSYKPLVMFMGGDFSRKGGPELFAAWREGQLHSIAELVLVTSWPIPENQIPPGVRVLRNIQGYSPEWFSCWKNADVFVMPTRSEAFGMVFQEAAAAGVPSMGPRITAIPEIVLDGQTGLLVEPKDRPGLIAALRRLIGSTGTCREFGLQAREHMKRVSNPAAYRDRLLRLLSTAALSFQKVAADVRRL